MVNLIFAVDISIRISASLDLAHRLARHDHAGHAVGAGRQRNFELRQTVTVGRDRSQHFSLAGGVRRRMQENPVQIIAGLFGRDRELGLVDHLLQVRRRHPEAVRHVAGIQIRKIALGQGLQREARAAGADRQHTAFAGRFEHDLRAVRQFAHDVEQHMRRNRGRAAGRDLGRDRLVDLKIEVGRLEDQLAAFCAQQNIGQDRNGVPALDHAMHVAERL
jgi:hypothetical protein